MCPCKIMSVFRREFKSYFDSPVAYVFLVAFLVLLGFLTFGLSNYYERGQAVLTPFFIWHPWVYLLLVPAATMGLWAFPILITTAYLGNPDWGAVICGYVGSFFLAGAATAIGVFASSLSRSQVIGFVVALAILFTLLIIGFDPVLGAIAGWGVPTCVTDALSSCSLLKHYMSLGRGVLDFADVGYYVGMIVFMLAAAQYVTDSRKAS